MSTSQLGASRSLEFRLLGPLEVCRDGQPLRLGGERQRGLLALLLLHANELVTTDRIVDQLFQADASDAGVKALRVAVSRLRRLLLVDEPGEGVLVTRPGGYLLRAEPGQVDVALFETLLAEGRTALAAGDALSAAAHLREALALCRGPTLADLALLDFVQPEIGRLDELRLAALMERIDADLALGRDADIVPEIEALVKAHPYQERLRGQLMLALYRSGRQTDALEAYRQTSELLRGEFGLEPNRALQDLERAILTQDASLELRSPLPQTVPSDRALQEARSTAHPANGDNSRESGLPGEAPVVLPTSAHSRSRWGTRRLLLAACGLAVASVAVALPLSLSGGSRAASLAANSVGVFDPQGHHLTRSFAAGSRPSGVAFGYGSVWVANTGADTMTRFDRTAGSARDTIQVGVAPADVVVGAGSVWVANSGSGTVSRVSPETDTVVATLTVGNGPIGLAVAGGSVWVANSLDGTVSRIDMQSDRVGSPIAVGGTPVAIAATKDAVWVADRENGVVEQLDPQTGTVVDRMSVGNEPSGLAVDSRSVWVANALDATISRIDAKTGRVSAVVGVDGNPIAIALENGSVWVASSDGVLSRIDPGTGRVTSRVALGATPGALAAGGGTLWLTGLASPSSHRGGTLRVAAGDIVSPNPQATFDLDSWRLLSSVYDGLVAYRHVDGAAGAEIVPDLAAAVPQPTNGGTTYTFRLRPNVRFSNGALVRPRDVRFSLERAIRLGNPFLGAIVGAPTCTPKKCDLTGVAINGPADTVTIRLRQPDPDLLQELALPISVVVQFGTPLEVTPARLPAGTGPYQVSTYVAQKRLVLTRNPRFQVFAPEARPGGYPDRIVAEHFPGDAVKAVERGKLDVAELSIGSSLTPFATRYNGQVHVGPVPAVVYAFLNSRVPPLNDIRVRRALNLAVNRATVVKLVGGPLAAQPTCQILPPGIPGYRPDCPYTLHPTPAGAWTAPNLAQAQTLVAQSGTRGTKVVVWIDASRLTVGRYLVSVLEQLGYRASLRVPKDYYAAVQHGNPQIGSLAWNLDYLSPLNILEPIFECNAPFNFAHACSRTLDESISRASRDSAAADLNAAAQWAAIDRRLVAQAVMLPLATLRYTVLTSHRVGNVLTSPLYGTLLDQLWVH